MRVYLQRPLEANISDNWVSVDHWQVDCGLVDTVSTVSDGRWWLCRFLQQVDAAAVTGDAVSAADLLPVQYMSIWLPLNEHSYSTSPFSPPSSLPSRYHFRLCLYSVSVHFSLSNTATQSLCIPANVTWR